MITFNNRICAATTSLIIALGFGYCLAEESGEFKARVVFINDGDTCRIRSVDGEQYRVRFFGIDAPESDQPYGQIARQALSSLIENKEILVKLTDDRTYGRVVARVYVDGDTYVNQAMLKDGWAWHYETFTQGDERKRFSQAEDEARASRAGLWADSNPVRPECWRRGDRDGDCRFDSHFRPIDLGGLRFRDDSVSSVPHERTALSLATRSLSSGRDETLLSPLGKFRRFIGETALSGEAEDAEILATAGRQVHTIFGSPVAIDNRFRFIPPNQHSEVPGITELQRTAFTVGHYDRYRLPAWVAMRWGRDEWVRGQGIAMPRPKPSSDQQLPAYARGGTSFEYQQTGLQRGHMARDDDMGSWGKDAVQEASLMSNMVPQLEGWNHSVWTLLEDEHREIVANDEDSHEIDAVWIVAGPVFDANKPVRRVGVPGTAVPHATFKILAWFSPSGQLHARAYVIEQEANLVDLSQCLERIDDVEALTGLNFFPDLPKQRQDELEAALPTQLWD